MRFCIRPIDGAFKLLAIMDIRARSISFGDLAPEGQMGHLITNALARPFLHLLFPTRRPRPSVNHLRCLLARARGVAVMMVPAAGAR